MIELKFFILAALYNAERRQMSGTQLINLCDANPRDAQRALDDLVKVNYINRVVGCDKIKLSKRGIEAFESEKERREQYANQNAEKTAERIANAAELHKQQKKQFRHDFFIAAFSSLLGAVFALLIEHLQEIKEAIFSLFNS